MYNSIITFLLFLLFFTSCSAQDLYCVDVDYYNSKTGTQSSYRLTAEVSSSKLVKLNFPSGGHIDDTDFGEVYFEDNVAYAVLKGGKSYKVELLSKGADCFDDVSHARQCKGKTKGGVKCKNKTDESSGYCWKHLNN